MKELHMLIAFTAFHVLLSLIGIGTGLLFVRDLLLSQNRNRWTSLYLGSTIATSVTGFLFPANKITAAHILGIISLAVLALAVASRKKALTHSGWRRSFLTTSILALYLNSFVLVVQMFLKIPFLNALAPTQTELPFKLVQLGLLVLFCLLGFRAMQKYHPELEARPRSAGATA
jgi:hypothetical protein